VQKMAIKKIRHILEALQCIEFTHEQICSNPAYPAYEFKITFSNAVVKMLYRRHLKDPMALLGAVGPQKMVPPPPLTPLLTITKDTESVRTLPAPAYCPQKMSILADPQGIVPAPFSPSRLHPSTAFPTSRLRQCKNTP